MSLEAKTLRWTSPTDIDDAIHVNGIRDFPFDHEGLLDSMIKMTTQLIFSRERPHNTTPILNAINRWRDENRFHSAEEAQTILRELLQKIVTQRWNEVEAMESAWLDHLASTRICCFCAKPDNIAAWERFGDKHKGIALRFKSSETAGTQSPKQVGYQKERAYLTTLKEQLSTMLYNRPVDVVKRYDEQLLKKSHHLKAEDEWRCIRSAPKSSSENGIAHDDLPFDTEDLSGIYFGVGTPELTKEKFQKVAKKRFPKAALYQIKLANNNFALDIEKIETQ